MREILFRGQHRRYGEHVNMAGEKLPPVWVYGGVLQGEGDFSIIYGSKSPDGKFEKKYPVYTETLGQYTGLTDKNGTKIFEGDIVTFEDAVADYEGYHDDVFLNRGEVTYTERGMCLYFTNRQVVVMDDLFYKGTADCEVIGNIYDNPELAGEEDTL